MRREVCVLSGPCTDLTQVKKKLPFCLLSTTRSSRIILVPPRAVIIIYKRYVEKIGNIALMLGLLKILCHGVMHKFWKMFSLVQNSEKFTRYSTKCHTTGSFTTSVSNGLLFPIYGSEGLSEPTGGSPDVVHLLKYAFLVLRWLSMVHRVLEGKDTNR